MSPFMFGNCCFKLNFIYESCNMELFVHVASVTPFLPATGFVLVQGKRQEGVEWGRTWLTPCLLFPLLYMTVQVLGNWS